MYMSYESLDDRSREFMLKEIERDIASHNLYISRQRLNDHGKLLWPQLMREAAQAHDDVWLARQLEAQFLLAATETRSRTGGGVTVAEVPLTAATTLATSEFNRFYIRGVCLKAIRMGLPHVEVYRAMEVANPRPDSQALIGKLVVAEELLNDLRRNVGRKTDLGIPGGPNSGISVRLPKA